MPIIRDMDKCFLDKKEANQIRMLAYKRYRPYLPTTSPSKLALRFIDRSTPNRGIKNLAEIVELLKHVNGVSSVGSFVIYRRSLRSR